MALSRHALLRKTRAGAALLVASAAALAQTGGWNSPTRAPNVLPPHGMAAGDPSYGGQASDTIITAHVKAALLGAQGVDSSDVHVVTDRGTVTLTGTVPDSAQRDKVESTVQALDGVVSVVNELKVAKGAQ
jgi:osmotically-inducible protein OsmY